MSSLPAHCPRCGHNFWAESVIRVEGPGTAEVFLSGNFTDCPRCGWRRAILGEGLFAISADAVRVLAATDLTLATIRRLTEIFEEARRSEEAPEGVAARVEEISPDLAGVIRARPWTREQFLQLSQVILAALSLIVAAAGVTVSAVALKRSAETRTAETSTETHVHHHYHYEELLDEAVRRSGLARPRPGPSAKRANRAPPSYPSAPYPDPPQTGAASTAEPNPKRGLTDFQKAEREREALTKPDHGGVPKVKAKYRAPRKAKLKRRRREQ